MSLSLLREILLEAATLQAMLTMLIRQREREVDPGCGSQSSHGW